MRKFKVTVRLKYEFSIMVLAIDKEHALRLAKEQDPQMFLRGKRIKVVEVTDNE